MKPEDLILLCLLGIVIIALIIISLKRKNEEK